MNRVNDFINYCRDRSLLEKTQLTRAGVEAFARWYARSYKLDFNDVFDRMDAALSTWAPARITLGDELPAWVSAHDPLASLSPMLREFAEHLREHRGSPPATIHTKTEHIKKFLSFLRESDQLI